MPHATQSYPQYNPSACTSCEACLNNCPIACIHFNPLFIMSDECILCEQCIRECPEGDKVFAQASKLLGKEWQWFVQPPASEIVPSNPSEAESSTESKGDSSASKKDNEQDSSQESNKGESKDDSSTGQNPSQDSSFTTADKAKLEALKNALLSAPPPYKIQSSAKVINAIDSLKRYISTMS